jgi:hypothetical protein
MFAVIRHVPFFLKFSRRHSAEKNGVSPEKTSGENVWRRHPEETSGGNVRRRRSEETTEEPAGGDARRRRPEKRRLERP